MEDLQQHIELIGGSGLFDRPWYLAQYPDVVRLGMDPVAHYLRIGAKLLRNPGPKFDTAFYLRSYPDVAQAQINPLVHFIAFGQKEQRLAQAPGKAGVTDIALLKEALVPTGAVAAKPAAPVAVKPAATVAAKPAAPVAVRKQPAKARPAGAGASLRVGVYLPAAAIRNDMADVRAALARLASKYALYVSAGADNLDELKRTIGRHFSPVELVLLPEAGSGDQAPIRALRQMRADGIQLVCFLASSQGLGDAGWLTPKLRQLWFKRSLSQLLGNAGGTRRILEAFETNANLGLVGPAVFYKPASLPRSLRESALVRALSGSAHASPCDAEWSSFAGGMFWARLDMFAVLPDALQQEQADAADGAGEQAGSGFDAIVGLLPRLARMQTAVVHAATLGDETVFLEIIDSAGNPYRKSLERTLVQEQRMAADLALLADSPLFDRAFYLAQMKADHWSEGDPALHYLRFGEDFGYEPSAEFDGKRYLRYYPDVATSTLNPLVHYLRFGRDAQRDTFAAAAHPQKDRGVRVFISCWLKNKESLHDGLAELAERLRQQGVNPIFVTNARPLIQNPQLSVLASSFLLSDCDVTGPELPACFPSWLAEIAAIELRWLETAGAPDEKRHPAALARTVRKAYAYWKSVLEQSRPEFMLVWGSTAPLSKLHLRLCQELSIPTLVLERGHFARCFSVDLLGQFAYGGVNLKPHASQLAPGEQTAVRAAACIDWVRNCNEVAYAKSNQYQDIETVLDGYRNAGRRIVLFIGVNDLGSGSAYAYGDIAERHALLYNSSLEAFRATRKAIEAIDPTAVLIIKPHPSDRHDYQREQSDSVILAKDWDINKLIGLVDACVAMSTTALARALVESTPIVSLGLSDLSMKGLTYECHSPTDLPVMLRSALIRENFGAMNDKAAVYLEYLFDEQLVGIDADVPTNFRIADFSAFLVKRIAAYAPLEHRHYSDIGSALRASDNPRKSVYYQEAYQRPSREALLPYHHPVDVVIPVYGDATVTKECIDSVLASKQSIPFRLIIVSDKSPFPDVVEVVDSYADRPDVVVLHNEINLGYPGTANRGMAFSDDADVIVLNSDTLVAKGWVERLQAHAFSGIDVATVTPMSNNASIFSCRNHPQGAELPGGLAEVKRINELFGQRRPDTVEVPVGHGFCMYIKRACIRSVGYFDELTFGRGYSEEVDFCLRARQAGFTNVCGTDVYVGHVGGVSFADTANTRKIAARRIIQERYPTYFSEISKFLATDPLKEYRNYE